jgi:hypothetical protein
MGGFISVLISALAAILLYGTGHSILFILAILITIACVWTWGIMHNYATSSGEVKHDRILQNMKLEGRSVDEIRRFDERIISPTAHDVDAVPDKLAFINMVSTIIGFILLITSIYFRFFI